MIKFNDELERKQTGWSNYCQETWKQKQKNKY